VNEINVEINLSIGDFYLTMDRCNLIDQMVNDAKKKSIQQIMLNQMGIILPIETS
jgi:hypothetical protein